MRLSRPATALSTLGALFLTANSPKAIDFHNVAAEAGLTRAIPNGNDESKEFIIETTGSGAAFVDYDNDGFLDILLVSGPEDRSRLYRNNGRGAFDDVTAETLPEKRGWGQGVCAGDYDDDGHTDLLITYWGRNSLLRNVEGRRFEDVTASAGLTQDRTRYNAGCSFFDYDRDGDLDLFVANYLKFDFETTPKPGANPYCFYRELPVACGPRGLPFDRNLLYRNNGDGSFSDVSAASGISKPAKNYSLGVLTADFNQDGWTDVYVACDRTASLLYVNQKDGTFDEEGLFRGVALDEDGMALSGMGVAAGDYDGNGRLDIFRTNFSDERSTLYRNRGKGDFDEATTRAGMAHNTRFVGWGAAFLDFDHDARQDLILVNGHVFPEVDRLDTDIRYRDRAVAYRNLGGGKFADISKNAGPGIIEKHAARGLAVGDFDNDGVLEVLINNQNEPPTLLKQVTQPKGNWIQLQLVGTVSNRSAIGARVELTAGGVTQAAEVRSGGSYLSQSDFRLHFGLGAAETCDRVEIRWPNGGRQVIEGLAVNEIHPIEEQRKR